MAENVVLEFWVRVVVNAEHDGTVLHVNGVEVKRRVPDGRYEKFAKMCAGKLQAAAGNSLEGER